MARGDAPDPSPARPGAKDPDGSARAADAVPGWRPSGTLDALQELVDVAGSVPGAVARRAGMSTTELHALRHLMHEPRGPVELAGRLGVTSAAASGVVDRLVGHGHVERRAHPEDGRRTAVVITESGRAEVLARLQPMFAALAALDAPLGERERAVVEGYLRGATEAMRRLL